MDHSTGAVRIARVKRIAGHGDFESSQGLEKVLVLADIGVAFWSSQADIERALDRVDGRVDLDVMPGKPLLQLTQEGQVGLLSGQVDSNRSQPVRSQE